MYSNICIAAIHVFKFPQNKIFIIAFYFLQIFLKESQSSRDATPIIGLEENVVEVYPMTVQTVRQATPLLWRRLRGARCGGGGGGGHGGRGGVPVVQVHARPGRALLPPQVSCHWWRQC